MTEISVPTVGNRCARPKCCCRLYRRDASSLPWGYTPFASGVFWFVVVTLSYLFASSPGMVRADATGSIRGRVQQQGQGVADHRMMLIRFGQNQDMQRIPGQTDAEGYFVFEHLESGPAFTYVVGIRVDEQLYRSAPIVLNPGQQQEGIVVEVGEQGTAAVEPAEPQIHIAHHLIAIVWRHDRLAVQEVVEVVNSTSSPYQGAPAHGGQAVPALFLPLPDGYENFQNFQGLSAEHVQLQPSGLAYIAPLEPGNHRLRYTYTLPMSDRVMVILARRTLPTRVFDILVEATQLVATSDLQLLGRSPIESHSFLHFRGTELPVQSRSWLQVTRITGPASLVRLGSYGLVIGIALLGLLIPLSGVWRTRPSQVSAVSVAPRQIQQWQAAHLQLLRTIAGLDDQHEAGTLDDATYEQRRRAYKRQLLDVVEQLHQAQQYKETIT